MADDYTRAFGGHVRSLRHARAMTQEGLADRSGLSPDTIRRLEHGAFSPTIDTLRKLGAGLNLRLSTLFEGFELGGCDARRELIDLLRRYGTADIERLTRIIRMLLDEWGGLAREDDEEG